jgi:predicted ABC-type exoprotein transport system permease subunit
LIRCARVSTDIDLLTRVVVWSVQHMVYVPVGLISDAISMLYRYVLILID